MILFARRTIPSSDLAESKSFHSSCGRASNFSLLVQRKVTKRKHALGIALFGPLARKVRVSGPVFRRLHIPARTAESARSLAPTLRALRPAAAATRREPEERRAKHDQRPSRFWKPSLVSSAPHTKSSIRCTQGLVQGWTVNGAKPGAVRGAEHRRLDRKMPAGARARCARVGCLYTDVLSADPGPAEKRRGFRCARCAAKHRVRRLAFCLLLGTAPQERRERRSRPRSGGGQDARSHAQVRSLARRASDSLRSEDKQQRECAS